MLSAAAGSKLPVEANSEIDLEVLISGIYWFIVISYEEALIRYKDVANKDHKVWEQALDQLR